MTNKIKDFLVWFIEETRWLSPGGVLFVLSAMLLMGLDWLGKKILNLWK